VHRRIRLLLQHASAVVHRHVPRHSTPAAGIDALPWLSVHECRTGFVLRSDEVARLVEAVVEVPCLIDVIAISDLGVVMQPGLQDLHDHHQLAEHTTAGPAMHGRHEWRMPVPEVSGQDSVDAFHQLDRWQHQDAVRDSRLRRKYRPRCQPVVEEEAGYHLLFFAQVLLPALLRRDLHLEASACCGCHRPWLSEQIAFLGFGSTYYKKGNYYFILLSKRQLQTKNLYFHFF
jgi:hypothetical protein